MPANERGSLRAAFSNFNRHDAEKEAELKLLGRTVEPVPPEPAPKAAQPAAGVPHAASAPEVATDAASS